MNTIRITKSFWYLVLAIMCFEVLSLAGWSWPLVGKIAFWLILGLTGLVAFWRLDIALWVVLAELVVGSKGYLFSGNVGSFSASIRLGLFCVVIAVWLITRLTKHQVRFFKSKLFWWYAIFLGALGWGIVNALIRHHPAKNIFLDVNGFLYLGLIFVFYEVITDRKKIATAIEIILAGLTAVAIKTLVLLLIFASQVSFLPSLYRWVRDTRVNEITLISHNFYRVFSQSQIYCLFGAILILVILTLAVGREGLKKHRALIILYVLATTTILISYSRSLWLSLAVTLIFVAVIFVRTYHYRLKGIVVFGGAVIGIFIAEIGCVYLLVNAPQWLKARGGGVSLSTLVEERIGDTNEVALQSRWNLITPLGQEIWKSPILGQGFGSEVTYLSKDPRIVANTGGLYKTYSFEWGYLDLALKLGLIGLTIYALFLFQLFRIGIQAYRKNENGERIFILGLLLALVSLLITHATTPYLNHPLGLGFIMVCAVIFEQFRHGKQQDENQLAAAQH